MKIGTSTEAMLEFQKWIITTIQAKNHLDTAISMLVKMLCIILRYKVPSEISPIGTIIEAGIQEVMNVSKRVKGRKSRIVCMLSRNYWKKDNCSFRNKLRNFRGFRRNLRLPIWTLIVIILSYTNNLPKIPRIEILILMPNTSFQSSTAPHRMLFQKNNEVRCPNILNHTKRPNY